MRLLTRLHPLSLGAVALALVAAACGSTPTSSPTSTPAMSEMMSPSPGMMHMQPGADAMKVSITSPATATVVHENSVTLAVGASGYTLDCNAAGKPDQQGVGHYHVLIDKSLVNMFCTPTATVSMQNVKPGVHTFTVVPAQNDHAEIDANAKSITVDYEPTNPLAAITDASFPGAASIKILSPANGATLSGAIAVTVQINNFNANCDLYGKPAIAGYGHWHLNFDSTTAGMMGMGTMGGMSCTTTFHTTTAGLSAGQHTLIALLVDNGHAPLMPAISDSVTITVQ